MQKLICVWMSALVMLSLAACGAEPVKDKDASSGIAESEDIPVEQEEGNNDWAETFAEAGFAEDEIAGYREIIETVGATELHDVDVIENGVMHIVRGEIYDSSNLQLNVTLENREIIYIELAGIPDVKNVPYINWRGKLKNKKVNTKTSVELYSDTEGGYEGILVWEDKFIYPCDENGVILED